MHLPVPYTPFLSPKRCREERDNGSPWGYTYRSVPSSTPYWDLQTISYYDTYDMPGLPLDFVESGHSNKTHGLLTATLTKVLKTTNAWLWTVYYYNNEGRVEKKRTQQYFGMNGPNPNTYGTDDYTYSYNDITGELLSVYRAHTGWMGSVTAYTEYEYDHGGRKKRTYQTMDNGTNGNARTKLSEETYNERGQVWQKSWQNGEANTSNEYTQRGWLKHSVTDVTSPGDQLAITLNYQDGNSPQWNGNITDQYWGTFANRNKYYNYGYDKLGRLTYGASGQSKGESYQYDKNGNITQLYREGRGVNEYNYVGNLLGSIGGSNTFRPGYMTWDWNGNLSYDSNEGRSYYYYSFDKPWYTTKGPDLVAWAYDPNGRKLERYSTLTGRSDFYQDGVHYLNGNLDYVQTGEGIARKSGGTYTYEYYIKDHLGNTRESIAKNPTSGNMEVVQKADYFPFGLEIPVTTPGNKDPYLYNGKELDEELTQYDYGARFYDPVIGRFNSIDPHAENSRRWSPYTYGLNNPLRFIDPDGMDAKSTHTDEFGNVLAVYNDGDLGVYRHQNNKDGSTPTEAQIDKRHSKSTSAGGEKMGGTEFWDEFIAPGDNKGSGTILFSNNPEQSWDKLIAWGNEHANNQDLTVTMNESKLNQVLDIKNNGAWASEGPMTGRLLNGKYATARSAGNYLAGLNGMTGTIQGQHISGATYMKLAGAYQAGELNKINILRIMTFGTSFGPAPYYGEQPYSGRRILQGINAGLRTR